MSEKSEKNVVPIFKKTPGFPVLDFVDVEIIDGELVEVPAGDLGGFVLRGFAKTPEEALTLLHKYQDTPFPTKDKVKNTELIKIPPFDFFLYEDQCIHLINRKADRCWSFNI